MVVAGAARTSNLAGAARSFHSSMTWFQSTSQSFSLSSPMMLCLEKRLKSNTCITTVDSSREDLEIWDRRFPVGIKGSGVSVEKTNENRKKKEEEEEELGWSEAEELLAIAHTWNLNCSLKTGFSVFLKTLVSHVLVLSGRM